MSPRKVLLVLVATSLVAACSDDDGTAPRTTSPRDTRPAPTITVDPPGAPTTTAPDDERRAQVAETIVVDAPELAGAGRALTVTGLFAVGRVRIAVGSVQNLQDGHHRPLVLESPAGTGEWDRQPAVMPDGAVDAVVASAVRFDGNVLVLGTQWTGDGTSGVAWERTAEGFIATDLRGAIAQDGSQIVHGAAASPLGLVAFGTDDGDDALWTSGDGVEWNVPTIEGDRDRLRFIDVAANEFGMLVVAVDGDRPVALFSADGVRFHIIHEADPREALNVVTAVGDELVIGGGVNTGDRREPRLWRVVDGVWPESPEQGNLPASEYGWGSDAVVTALASDQGRLLFMVDGTLIASPRPGIWRRRAAAHPPMSPEPSTLVSAPGATTHAEVVVGGTIFYAAGDTDWEESTPEAIHSPYRQVELSGIAHRGGTWVVAATVTDGVGRTRTVAWYSTDGETWQPAHELQRSRGTAAAAVGLSAEGFVVAGSDRQGRRVMLWTSGDGRSWDRLTGPELRWPRRTELHPTSVVSTPYGFAVSGYATIRGGRFEPWLVRVVGDDVRTASDLPQTRRGVGASILGSCHPPGNLAFVGARHGRRSEPAWWSREGDAPWEAHGLEGAGELRECIATRRDLLAVGTSHDGVVVVSLHGSDADVSSLPRGGDARAADLAFLGERLVVVGEVGDHARNGRLWVSDDADRGEWTILDTAELGGPGVQTPIGVAGPREGPLIVALDDGASGRLVAIRLLPE